jgi:urease accessory protein
MLGTDAGCAELLLLAWLSPAFPIGGFAYSHGLESAVDAGDIVDAASLTAWLTDLLDHGSARNDVIITAAAWRATLADDSECLREANDLALAFCASRERRLEATAQGNAFATTIRAAWPDAACPILPEGDVVYPVAFGSACAMGRLNLLRCLEAFALAFAQNLISAAVRLGAIGQTDGQRVIAALVPAARRLASSAVHSSLDDVGGCAQRSDIASLRHETLYSRLFRS